MAIAMASVGGAGFLHYNMTQDEQVAHLKAVKAHRLGYVTRTEVRGPDATLAECDALATSRGFTSVVVTDTGIIGGKLLGLVSSRDGDLVMDRSTKLKDVMTKAADLVTGKASDAIEKLEDALLASKKGKLPVVNDKGELVGLMTRASIKMKKLLPPRRSFPGQERPPPVRRRDRHPPGGQGPRQGSRRGGPGHGHSRLLPG